MTVKCFCQTKTEKGKCKKGILQTVLWIRIRMDPELWPGLGSGIIVPDPDPAKHERADK